LGYNKCRVKFNIIMITNKHITNIKD